MIHDSWFRSSVPTSHFPSRLSSISTLFRQGCRWSVVAGGKGIHLVSCGLVSASLVFVESCVDCGCAGCGQGGVEWSRQSKSCLGSVPVSTQLNSALFCRLDFKLDLLSSSSSDCCSHSHPDQSDHLILLLISHRSSGPRIEKLEWDKSFPSHIKA